MYECQESILIANPRAVVYRTAETYPLFVRFYRRADILYQDDRFMRVQVGSKVLGMPTSWIGEGRKTPLEKIDFTQVQGLFKGLQAHWRFSDAGAGTLVTIRINFALPIPMIGRSLACLLGNLAVRKTVKGILSELKQAAERPPAA